MQTNTIGRRLTTAVMATVVALGLVLGAVAFAPQGADALPRYNPTGEGGCYFAGYRYSDGSVIRQGDGRLYKCDSGRGGWILYA